VSLGYGEAPVLTHVSLSITRGDFIALVGPNGAGKTTLFRGMLGLIPVLAGRVEYGFDRKGRPPGYVPQRDNLDPIFPLTAFEVTLMGTFAGLPPLWPIGRERRRLAAQCLAQVGLAEISNQPFWALSGGQKQRVLIARALAIQPEVLLLDEPTAGIDPGAESSIMETIAKLNRDQRLTVVLVSHHLRLVRSLVRSVIWVENGMARKGTPEEMLAPERLAEIFGLSATTS
jgi:ABC-type Mn2+/Zn2+ transport system ATPase subunit